MRNVSLAIILATGFALSSVATDVEAGFGDWLKKKASQAKNVVSGGAKMAFEGAKDLGKQAIKSDAVQNVKSQVRQTLTDAQTQVTGAAVGALGAVTDAGTGALKSATDAGTDLVNQGTEELNKGVTAVTNKGTDLLNESIAKSTDALNEGIGKGTNLLNEGTGALEGVTEGLNQEIVRHKGFGGIGK